MPYEKRGRRTARDDGCVGMDVHDETSCFESPDLISDDDLGRLIYQSPQLAIDLLVGRARFYGVTDLDVIRAWGKEAIVSDPEKYDLACLNLVLKRKLAIAVRNGEVVFSLAEGTSPELN